MDYGFLSDQKIHIYLIFNQQQFQAKFGNNNKDIQPLL